MPARPLLALAAFAMLAACGEQSKTSENADDSAALVNGQQSGTPTAPRTATPLPGAAPGPMEPGTQTDPASANCGAVQTASYLGREATQDVRAELASAATSADTIRFRMPDTVVTQDRRTNRLNVMMDASGIIRDLRCG